MHPHEVSNMPKKVSHMNAQLLVSQVQSLFSLPEVALQVNELLNSPEPTNADLEEIIMHDPALTTQILKMVNSAYFGLSGTIDTVSRAITMLGLVQLRSLVLTTSVTSSFKGIPADLVDMDIFWYHSVTSGVLAKNLAKKLKHADSERLFIGGLLHSVGKLIYFSQLPLQAKEILGFKEQGEEAIISAEQKILGFTHAELGAEFLKQWKLPPNIWQTINFHLDPIQAKEFKTDACILHVAAKIASSIEPCAKHDFDFKELEPIFKPKVLEYLKITPNLMQHSIDESLSQAFEILTIINPQAMSIY